MEQRRRMGFYQLGIPGGHREQFRNGARLQRLRHKAPGECEREQKEISKKDWCATILKDYTGDLYIKRAPTEGSYDEIYVEGVGSINFTSRQTGL